MLLLPMKTLRSMVQLNSRAKHEMCLVSPHAASNMSQSLVMPALQRKVINMTGADDSRHQAERIS
jgi:hypothetical protein